MGPNPAEVTAVVPARNAEQMLPRCLEALRQSGVAEIIVVDGCSTDSTVDLALAAGAVRGWHCCPPPQQSGAAS